MASPDTSPGTPGIITPVGKISRRDFVRFASLLGVSSALGVACKATGISTEPGAKPSPTDTPETATATASPTPTTNPESTPAVTTTEATSTPEAPALRYRVVLESFSDVDVENASEFPGYEDFQQVLSGNESLGKVAIGVVQSPDKKQHEFVAQYIDPNTSKEHWLLPSANEQGVTSGFRSVNIETVRANVPEKIMFGMDFAYDPYNEGISRTRLVLTNATGDTSYAALNVIDLHEVEGAGFGNKQPNLFVIVNDVEVFTALEINPDGTVLPGVPVLDADTGKFHIMAVNGGRRVPNPLEITHTYNTDSKIWEEAIETIALPLP